MTSEGESMDITVMREDLSELLTRIEAVAPSSPLAHWLNGVEGEMDADSVVTLSATVSMWSDPAIPDQPPHLRRLK